MYRNQRCVIDVCRDGDLNLYIMSYFLQYSFFKNIIDVIYDYGNQ